MSEELHVLKLRVAALEARLAALESGGARGPASALPRMLSTKEAAPLLGVSETTLKRLIAAGKIKAKRDGAGSGARSLCRISEDELRRYMADENGGGS